MYLKCIPYPFRILNMLFMKNNIISVRCKEVSQNVRPKEAKDTCRKTQETLGHRYVSNCICSHCNIRCMCYVNEFTNYSYNRFVSDFYRDVDDDNAQTQCGIAQQVNTGTVPQFGQMQSPSNVQQLPSPALGYGSGTMAASGGPGPFTGFQHATGGFGNPPRMPAPGFLSHSEG